MKKDMISAVAGALAYALLAGCTAAEQQLPFEDVEYVKDFPVTYDVRNGRVVETGRIGLLDIMLCGSDTLLIATQDNGGFISAMNLDDGTMIVVEDGRRMIGKTADITVTSVLQTSAGRMIFGRLKKG